MTNLIQASEVTPFVRGRVIAILTAGLTPAALRVSSTAVGFEAYLKNNNLGQDITVDKIDLLSSDPDKAKEVKDFLAANRRQFAKTAMEIYTTDLAEQFVNVLFPQSTPDATGDSREVNSGPRCQFCGEVHE